MTVHFNLYKSRYFIALELASEKQSSKVFEREGERERPNAILIFNAPTQFPQERRLSNFVHIANVPI